MEAKINVDLGTSTIATQDVLPEILAEARKELNENPATVKEDIKAFRKLVLEDEELNAKLDDEFLLRFLRARKFNQQRALTLLQDYYKQRHNLPELFKSFKPQSLAYLFEDNMQAALINRDHLGRRIGVCRITKWDPAKCKVELLTLSFLMCMEKLIREEETQLCGFCGILDAREFSFYQARQVSVFDIKNAMNLLQRCFPARLKALHIINEGPIWRAIIAIVKTLLSKKLANRIHIHGKDLSSLHKHIHADILPSDLGGELPPLNSKDYYNSLLDSSDYFADLLSYGYGNKSRNSLT